MQLLQNSNNEMKQWNKNTSEEIINLQNNSINLLNEYDYSIIFDSCLKQVNSELNNFTGDIFGDLINLINNIYINYTIILEDVKNEKYDIFLQIRNVTKNEYINYIYKMILRNF